MNNKLKIFFLNLSKFIALNIVLWFFCFFTITPHFRSSAYSKMRIEDKNQINHSHYKLNLKTIGYREDYIIDNNTKKKIHKKKKE